MYLKDVSKKQEIVILLFISRVIDNGKINYRNKSISSRHFQNFPVQLI